MICLRECINCKLEQHEICSYPEKCYHGEDDRL